MIHRWLAFIGFSCLAYSKPTLWQSDAVCSFKAKPLKFTPPFMNAIWNDRFFGRFFSVCVNHMLRVVVWHSVITNHWCVFLHELNSDVSSNLTMLCTKFHSISGVADITASEFDSISGVADLTTSWFDFISGVANVTVKFDSISVVMQHQQSSTVFLNSWWWCRSNDKFFVDFVFFLNISTIL